MISHQAARRGWLSRVVGSSDYGPAKIPLRQRSLSCHIFLLMTARKDKRQLCDIPLSLDEATDLVTSLEHQTKRISWIGFFGAASRLNCQFRGIILRKYLVGCVIVPLQICANKTESFWLLFFELVESTGHKSLSKNWVYICTYK